MNHDGYPTNTSTSNSLKHLTIAATFLIIVVIAAGLGGYILGRKTSRSSVPTKPTTERARANWETYTRNGEFQYSYPSNWIIHEEVPPDGSSNVGDPSGKYPHGYLTVYRQFSRSDCVLEERMIKEGYVQTELREETGVIGSIPAKVFEGKTITDEGSYNDRKIILVFNANKGACYTLDYSASNRNQEQIFDEIVSTFTFLN